jgi:hypothetical protein
MLNSSAPGDNYAGTWGQGLDREPVSRSSRLFPTAHGLDHRGMRKEVNAVKLRSLEISYSQIAIFRSALQQPFNDWTDTHVRQGFAWRPGSVSFATVEQAGQLDVEVVRDAATTQSSRASRIIAVPFEVDESGEVEVASIADGEAISIPPGKYRLTFEHGLNDDGAMWCRL